MEVQCTCLQIEQSSFKFLGKTLYSHSASLHSGAGPRVPFFEKCFHCQIHNESSNINISLLFCPILGWATAELIMTRLVPLWVGARGVEFDWKYIQMSFDANVSLVSGSRLY